VLYRNLTTSIVLCLTVSLLVFSIALGNEPIKSDYISSIVQNSAPGPILELSPAYTGCGGVSTPAIREDYEQQVVDLVNQARANQNLPPLKRASELVNAARYHATDMVMDNYFFHPSYNRIDGNLAYVCDTFERIISFYSPNWRALAENIAAGQADPEWVMRSWMNSPGHRANILSNQTWELGVSYAAGGLYSHYWVQDFGRRDGVFPLIINQEAASTDNNAVDLYIYGDWQYIRLRNDDDAWGEWRNFQNQLTWVINGNAGEHTVWAEMRSGDQITASNDSIILTQAASAASLGNLPTSINFIYSSADGQLYPPLASIVPLNTGSSEILEWATSLDGDWFQISPGSGITPQAISIISLDYSTASTGSYQDILTVTVSSPSDVLNSPQNIQLNLLITSQPINSLFIPVARR
jgi:uncharacterized protein YkwD